MTTDPLLSADRERGLADILDDMEVGLGDASHIGALVNEARALSDQPAPDALDLGERIRDVRLLLIDGIGSDLSKEFAQGDPFEPFDRIYVTKRITRVLDAASVRARAALGEKP